MADLVPIKVKIGLRPNGHHDHPAFGNLPPEVRGGMDWSEYLDQHGLGWHYDKLSGHGETDRGPDPAHEHANHEVGFWYGATCVPAAFAEAAAAMFDTVTIITESSWASFYDDRSHVLEPEEHHDLEELQKLQSMEALAPGASGGAAARRAEALDPDHPRRGVRRNHNKTWALYKARRGVTIREEA